MRALLESYAPSQLLLALVMGANMLILGHSFIIAVAAALAVAMAARWLDTYGVPRRSRT